MNPKPLPQVIHLPCRKCGATRKHFGSSVCWDCMTPEERERLAHDDWPMPMPKPPPYPADDEGRRVAMQARVQGKACPACGALHLAYTACVPPPDVYEFYIKHWRWPEPDEA